MRVTPTSACLLFFQEVPADPVAACLLACTGHPEPAVRSVVLQLLTHLAETVAARDALAAAAVRTLTDDDASGSASIAAAYRCVTSARTRRSLSGTCATLARNGTSGDNVARGGFRRRAGIG